MKDLFLTELPKSKVTDVARVQYQDKDKWATRVEVLPFFRFFLLPGKAHGDTGLGVRQIYGEGQGVPLLAAIRAWREEGKAPAYLSCAHITNEDGKEWVKFRRNVYPYLCEKRTEGVDYPATTCRRYLFEE